MDSKILFVDDEPMILTSLTRLFEDDYDVHTAGSGVEALEKLRKNEFKVIISDQRMPGMLGHEVLKQAKLISPETIRILLTGYSDLDAILNSVNAGEIFRYVSKPWKGDSLASLLKLSIGLYDKIDSLKKSEQKKSQDLHEATPRGVHIEVQEKSGDVLFVDYDPNEAKALVSKYGSQFNVSSATSVDDAYKTLAQKAVSVVVSNINFTDVDGISFLNSIKKEYPEIVTVILTEVRDASLAVRSINELSVFKYLVKPSDDAILGRTIKEGFEKHKLMKSNIMTNVQYAASKISPDSVPVAVQENALRSRLLEAQARLKR